MVFSSGGCKPPIDKTPPVITLKGDNPVKIELDSTYIDVGATATDNVDGDLTSSIKVVNSVDTATLGSYKVAYSVSDKAGNSATETRIVNVVDTTPPVITLKGDNPVTVVVGSTYTDAGATATDNVDGDLTSSITVVNIVNIATVGTYTVTYNVSDVAGNAAIAVVRTVNVVALLKVHFIDVGQGDSILIDLGSEEVLIDGGEKSPGVVDYISQYIDGPLEVMVATHTDADHIGGLTKVLDDFQVEEIWLNGYTATSKTYKDFMAAVNAEGAEVNYAKRNGTISTESLNFSILNPPDTLFSDANNNSIVLRLEYGDTVFLFTGDAEKEAEASMLATENDLWAQILKVDHHGSSTASTIEFLKKVDPDIAIISCGEGNSYGHPNDITLNNLSNLGITIYRTDISGNIIVESDGLTYSVVEGDPFTYVEEKEQEKEQELPQEEQPVEEEQQVTYGINVVSLTSPISRGAQASITINTAPNILCTIAVYYKSGKSEAQGLEPKNSDGNGNCTWSWKVGARTTPGDWKIVLTAEGAGQIETYFTVTE
jgi:competence protein ComEC